MSLTIVVFLILGVLTYCVMGAGVHRLADRSSDINGFPLGLMIFVWPMILIFEAFS